MKKKQTPQDKWETEPSPVWVTENGMLKPSPYFLKWWQDLSISKYGDSTHWLDIAVELGYAVKETDPHSGEITYEPIGFDYDPELVRNTLGLPEGMPIVRYRENGRDAYQHMISKLLSDNGGNNGQ